LIQFITIYACINQFHCLKFAAATAVATAAAAVDDHSKTYKAIFLRSF
jgi:hypothetical protein